ncbi:hypothetical protein PPL_04816 [Heterostelium album PN500]|uniref:Cathepsin propeptide inhibitor domain-containing protein n=1 Tax=Heterostelium pallidum (strain ATCC 26659 / Pp 5 / PN500) TaxID=670386 RepID=D3B8M3_HETP5|nr:hypothetical protein PPL_04816 [Heterostelium album PN500]EFA82391.1 hypothetical protein PPL_04816 [Heterostelium album PN500]|eukprot:XP_020434508.1 hypothetical protein PPL_04816 [Heterostelium album PN500]
MKVLFFICCLTTLLAIANSQGTEYDFETAFKNYVEAYGKQYLSSDYQAAFDAFKENLVKIQKANDNWSGSNVHIEVPDSSNMRVLSAVDPIISFPSESYPMMELNQFSDLSFEQFSAVYTGVDASLAPEAAAAAGLSTGAIVGIAVGSAAAFAVFAGATVAVVRSRRSASAEIETSPKEEVQMKHQSRGIDIFKWRRSKHQSITARSVPIDKQ